MIGSRDCVTPPVVLEDDYFPSAQRIIEEIDRAIVPLDGHAREAVSSSPARR